MTDAPSELQKLTPTQLHDRLHDAVQRTFETEAALSAVYREFDRRRGKLEAIDENRRRSPYDFDQVKWRAAKVIERIIDDGLAGEIPIDEYHQVVSLLERYNTNAVAHALIVKVAAYTAMQKGQSAVPPFPYLEGKGGKQCH